MNRIRKVNNKYQVLITPGNNLAPDNPILFGNWTDNSLRGFYVLTFDTLGDAQVEAYKYPDIDWYRIIVNHEYIFNRLKTVISDILSEFNVDFRAKLQDPETFKNLMFDRVLKGGERFNLRYGFNDIISFTIINPWTEVLKNISQKLETHKGHLYLDELRLKDKKVIDKKIIALYGTTEIGTIYEIKLIPTVLHQWSEWYMQSGYRNPEAAMRRYNELVKLQDKTDLALNYTD